MILSYLPKIIQLVNNLAGIQTWVVGLHSLCSYDYFIIRSLGEQTQPDDYFLTLIRLSISFYWLKPKAWVSFLPGSKFHQTNFRKGVGRVNHEKAKYCFGHSFHMVFWVLLLSVLHLNSGDRQAWI